MRYRIKVVATTFSAPEEKSWTEMTIIIIIQKGKKRYKVGREKKGT